MSNLLTVEGPLYRGCVWIYHLMILTFLWLLFNCLIVTIGASTIALFTVSSKLVRSEEVYVIKEFFKNFKANFKKGVLLSGITYILVLNIFLSVNTILSSPFEQGIMTILNIFFIFEMSVILLYSYPIISRYELSVFNVLKNSFLIGNLHLFNSLTGCMVIILFIMFYSVSPLLFMICGGAMFSCLWCWMLKRVFRTYEQKLLSIS